MSSHTPAVSIVLPTFNRNSTIRAAIGSVLDQTWSDFELIVVDDGSDDDTDRVVQQLHDPRIRYVRHLVNRGGSAARNTGIECSRADWVAFQDSDDQWLPRKLELQMEALANGGERLAAIYCGYWRSFPDGSRIEAPAAHVSPREGDIHRSLLRENFIGTPTLVVRRRCLTEVGGFDEELPRFQDWDLMIRLSRDREVAYLDGLLVEAGTAEVNITSGHDAALEAAEARILEKHRGTLREAGEDLLAYRLWHLAHIRFMRGRMSEGRETLREAIALRGGPRYLAYLPLSYHAGLYRLAYSARSRMRGA